MIRENCAPSKIKKKFTCYTVKDLKHMKKKYNRTHRNKINTSSTKEIWKSLMSRLECKKESCLASSLKLKVERFAPKSPLEWKKNPNAWLSSTDITNVLAQYEKAYPHFIYIGPSPSDYYFKTNGTCEWEELCKFDVRKLTSEKRVGIVFNLDEHDGPGTHWVAVYIDPSKKVMYYFDSGGSKITKNISHLYSQIKEQDPEYKLIQNAPVEHQFGNTECGIYVLFFLVIMLKTDNFKHFNSKHTFSDKSMEKLRKKFFNTP